MNYLDDEYNVELHLVEHTWDSGSKVQTNQRKINDHISRCGMSVCCQHLIFVLLLTPRHTMQSVVVHRTFVHM